MFEIFMVFSEKYQQTTKKLVKLFIVKLSSHKPCHVLQSSGLICCPINSQFNFYRQKFTYKYNGKQTGLNLHCFQIRTLSCISRFSIINVKWKSLNQYFIIHLSEVGRKLTGVFNLVLWSIVGFLLLVAVYCTVNQMGYSRALTV